MRLRVDDTGAHHVVGIRVDAIEQLHAEAGQFVLSASQVERELRLKDFLRSLLLAVKKFFLFTSNTM